MESFGKEQVLLNAAQVALQLAQSITHTSIPVVLKIIIYNFYDKALLLVSGPYCFFSLLFSNDYYSFDHDLWKSGAKVITKD